MPFTLPRFLGPPELIRRAALVVSSNRRLLGTGHVLSSPIIPGPFSSSSMSSDPHATACDDESCRLCWFTRKFSSTCCSAAVGDSGHCQPGTPWPSLPPPQPTPTEAETGLLLPASFSSSPNYHHHGHLLHRRVARTDNTVTLLGHQSHANLLPLMCLSGSVPPPPCCLASSNSGLPLAV